MWKEYFYPSSIEEAFHLLDELRGKACIIAGGTDLVLEIERNQRPGIEYLVDITRIPGLDCIKQDEAGAIHIGSLVTHSQCAASPLLIDQAGLLAQACRHMGSAQIRNRGTIAGNLMTASPANDSIPPLVALNAELVFQSSRGTRRIPITQFYQGVRKTSAEPYEILTDIVFQPLKPTQKGIYLKLGLRKAQAISVVNSAVIVDLADNLVRSAVITMGAVAPTIIHAADAEAYLAGKSLDPEVSAQAAALAADCAIPISDVRSSAEYRRQMVQILIRRSLAAIAADTEKDDLGSTAITLSTQDGKISRPMGLPLKSFGKDDYVETTINGVPRRIAIKHAISLLDLLRDQAGETAAKKGCGEGECGACTVILNSSAVMGCLVPAACADGAEIQTVEGLSQDDSLHAIQQAFVDKGAVQCGACTSGMMMSAAALLQEIPHPSRQQVKEGIAGNLCRCTGYAKIVDAIVAAAEGRPSGAVPLDLDHESIVGAPLERIDAVTKVKGKALYAADMTLPGMLYGYTLRSPHAHARIVSIDTSAAQAMPGVQAVLTVKDIPGQKHFGNFIKDQQVLADQQTNFLGEAVALVAVNDPSIAEAALKAIQVEYMPLPAVLDLDEAIQENTPLVHEHGRLILAAVLCKGNIETGFSQSDLVVENTYQTQEIEHAYIETEAAFAVPGPAGDITVYSSVQHPHYIRSEVAAVLGLSVNKIRVVQTNTGGGFGGKIDVTLQHHAALLALKTQKPVRMVYSREESIAASYKRMPYRIHSRVGVARNGKLMAVKMDVLADAGAYVSHGKALLGRAIVHCVGPYVVPHIEANGYYTFTHKVPNSAMRGYGTPGVLFAMEQQLNRIGKELGIDPITLRHMNALKLGDETATGQCLVTSVGLQRTIEEAGRKFGWSKPDSSQAFPGGEQ